MHRKQLNERLPDIVTKLVNNIHELPEIRRLGTVVLPSRDTIVGILDNLRQLVFPGYFGLQGLTAENLQYRIGELVLELTSTMYEQVRCCLRYREGTAPEEDGSVACEDCDQEAARITATFFDRLPHVREMMTSDVLAAFEGDPAAQTTDETIFSYPGLYAIMVQRIAHELFNLQVPLLPRIMTEHAHSITGIDIHPGAQLGRSFMIDHGTGVVIGETTVIGNNVKLYQGVTLGALAPAFGQALRGHKRHPTIQDDVVIYAGATILGGDTVIGSGAVIGGNVFVTSSVPSQNQVVAEPPKLKFRDRRSRARQDVIDFQI
ncbi:MAG: serine acetyltransferase [Burkholderiales bacterium]|nr:serine acetyltransferase [Phycisphaerae bacterium]